MAPAGPAAVSRVGVVGGGLMGSGIAQVAASSCDRSVALAALKA